MGKVGDFGAHSQENSEHLRHLAAVLDRFEGFSSYIAQRTAIHSQPKRIQLKRIQPKSQKTICHEEQQPDHTWSHCR